MFYPVQEVLTWVGQVLNVTIPFLALNSTTTGAILSYTTYDDFITHCTSFASRSSLPGATIHFSQHVPAGTNLSLPENHPSCGLSSWTVSSDMCRVAMSVPTSETSEMSVEAWFPYEYTGRFLTTTNRGTPCHDMLFPVFVWSAHVVFLCCHQVWVDVSNAQYATLPQLV